MCRGLVENEKPNTPRMCLLENRNCLVDLSQQLGMISPRIPSCSQIDNGSCILDNLPFLVADDKPSILFLDKIGDMDDVAMPLFLEDLFTWSAPFHTCEQHRNGFT